MRKITTVAPRLSTKEKSFQMPAKLEGNFDRCFLYRVKMQTKPIPTPSDYAKFSILIGEKFLRKYILSESCHLSIYPES